MPPASSGAENQRTPACINRSTAPFEAGAVIAQAGEGEETLLAELDLAEVAEGLANLDTDGHYARPDVFDLTVDTRAKDGVAWQ